MWVQGLKLLYKDKAAWNLRKIHVAKEDWTGFGESEWSSDILILGVKYVNFLPAYGDDSSLSALTFIPPVILQ